MKFSLLFLVLMLPFYEIHSKLYYDTTIKSIARSGKNIDGTEKISFDLKTNVYEVSLKYCEVDILLDNLSPSSRYGHDFLETYDSEEKAIRLASLTKGINIQTARKLIEDGYFKRVPQSWSKFSEIILLADEKYKIGFSYEVLVKNRTANMASLGFLGFQPIRKERKKVLCLDKQFKNVVIRSFEIYIKEAPLLDDETELITALFDGIDDGIFIDSKFNAYEIERAYWNNDVRIYELVGKRIKVPPPNNIIVTVEVDNSQIILSIKDLSFDRNINQLFRRTIVGTGFNLRKMAIFQFSFDLLNDRPTTSSRVTFKSPLTKTIFITYHLRYDNNPFYEEWSNSRTVIVPLE